MYKGTDVGVILSAGQARRMGAPKALLNLQGEPIIERLLRAFCAALPRVIVVASGPTLAHLQGRMDITLVPGDPEAQMIDSLALAIERARSARSIVMQPVDAPFTSPEMISSLLRGAGDRPRAVAYEGRAGHPALVPSALFERVLEKPQGGLRALIADTIELVPWPDPSPLADLDTPEDYARALEQWGTVGPGGQG